MDRLITFVIMLLAVAPAIATSASCPYNSTSTPTLPNPIALVDVPATFANAGKHQSAGTVSQILNTLFIYPLCLDGKDFASLSRVFAENIIANYSAPFPPILTPLSALAPALEEALVPVDTQHSSGTQIVEVLDECNARSVSYVTAAQLGRGNYTGQVRVIYICALTLLPALFEQ